MQNFGHFDNWFCSWSPVMKRSAAACRILGTLLIGFVCDVFWKHYFSEADLFVVGVGSMNHYFSIWLVDVNSTELLLLSPNSFDLHQFHIYFQHHFKAKLTLAPSH